MSGTVEYDLTANYGLKKPWDDADDDVWGLHLNENMDLIDNLLVTRGFDASKYLPLAGGTMLGELILAADPANPLDAATKRYVDGSIGGAVGAYLPLTGGEVSGDLQVDGALNVGTPGGAGFKLDVAGTGRFSGMLTANGGVTVQTSAMFNCATTFGTNTTAQVLLINGPTGQNRGVRIQTAGNARWQIHGSATAEGGSNAGTDLDLVSYTDAGAVLGNPVARIIRRSGNVLINSGVDAGFKLDVVGAGRFDDGALALPAGITGPGRNLILASSDGINVSLVPVAFGNGATNNIHGYVAGGTRAAPAASPNSQAMLTLSGRGYGTTAFASAPRAFIQLRTAEAWSDTAQGAAIMFYTTPLTTTATAEVMRLQPSGNVGIGTGTEAGFKLDVVGTARISGALTLSNGGIFTGTFSGAHTYSGALTLSGGATVGTSASFQCATTVGSNTVAQVLALNGPAASSRVLRFQTAGLNAWQLVANSSAQSGGNAGGDLDIGSFDDTGAILGNPVARITRATGLLTLYFGLTVNAGAARFNGTIGFNNTAPIAKPTVTGAKAGNTALASLCAALVSYGLIADTSTA